MREDPVLKEIWEEKSGEDRYLGWLLEDIPERGRRIIAILFVVAVTMGVGIIALESWVFA